MEDIIKDITMDIIMDIITTEIIKDFRDILKEIDSHQEIIEEIVKDFKEIHYYFNFLRMAIQDITNL
jgi:hypothetical protein